ncbi:hypothetical protein CTEN210_13578 [Chaetoceros tenuissimus]|uniref:TIR domain-containing protein n=1 Tax=Chaetoceros tenuissimus TaxID=426638 RepID=A0AAD3D3B1_9STRA|nr:hypothetical protein CTEN210_13578 [Chaetoceros tenuissimus]
MIQETFDVFLSHNWGQDEEGRDNHARVMELSKALQEVKIKPWMDSDQMDGHIGQAMTDGIDASNQVAVFITRRYIDKVASRFGMEDNCRLEFDYSTRRKGIKNLIPIVMEQGCKNQATWNGVLGATLNNQLYLDYSTDENLSSVVKDIVKRLQHNTVVQFEHGKYKGAVDDNNDPHGFGKMQYLDGSSYDGPWEHGVRNGKNSTFIFKNKDRFDGQFIEDEMHYGTYIERNGNKYIGFFNNGEREGRGKYFLKGRELPIYEGEYHNGKRHGEGVLDDEFGFYEGNFDSDYKHGKGTLTIPNVGVYEGQFVLGRMETSGKFEFERGDKYDGEFKENKFDGEGTYTYQNGASYVGRYRMGEKHGLGKYTFADGSSYDGEWKENMMHGEGERKYANGDVYNGNFEKNKRSGNGIMRFAETHVEYRGDWQDDKMNGRGVMVNIDNIRDDLELKSPRWKFRNKKKINSLSVEWENGSLTACEAEKKKKRNFFQRKKRTPLGSVLLMNQSDDPSLLSK